MGGWSGERGGGFVRSVNRVTHHRGFDDGVLGVEGLVGG